MEPLVSILIPCHNAAPWLEAALESALAQTWPRCEVILVDDGSTDASPAIASRYGQRGITVLAQPQRGASAARNAALRAARGDYIQFLDADDLLLPDKIERQLRRLAAAGGRFVAAAEWARFRGDPAWATSRPDALWRDLDPIPWQQLALRGNLMMHPAAWLVPRAIVEAAGPWDEALSLNDDGEYFARIRFAADRVLFCAGARSLYRSGTPGSLSSPSSRGALASAFRSHEQIHALLLSRDDGVASRRACADGWMHFAFAAHPVAPDLAEEAVRRASLLGGSTLQPAGGACFRLICRAAGWRTALHWRKRAAHLRR